MGVFLFHPNLGEDRTKIQDIQEGLSFSPEFGRRLYQNSGHTGGSIFFTQIWAKTVPNFRTYRRVFLFHPNLGEDRTKIQDIQEGLSFSAQFGQRPYQNSGKYRRVFLFHQNLDEDHTKIQGNTGGSFFFTRIWTKTIPKFREIQEGLSFSPEFGRRPYQNSGKYRRVFLFHPNLDEDHTKIQGNTG